MLFWVIRYLDRTDKTFKDRNLALDTETLSPVERAAVELIIEIGSSRSKREILKFRHLFREESPDDRKHAELAARWRGFCLPDYFEDETGAEIKQHKLGNHLKPEGSPESEPPRPVPVAEVSLAPDEVRLLAYFLRDHRELAESALRREGPGTLQWSGGLTPTGHMKHSFETALTDDEIRSAVTIHRRLCMKNEPANVEKAAELFVRVLGDHPYARQAAGFAGDYRKRLDAFVNPPSFGFGGPYSFKTKRLIEVFLYTRYAHQPDERREEQFAECLEEVGNDLRLLFYLFLRSLWETSIHIGNVGNWIDRWFQSYCSHHKIKPMMLDSLQNQGVGIGALEKKDDRKARLIRERTEELAGELWEQAGRPAGGLALFRKKAREDLERAMRGHQADP